MWLSLATCGSCMSLKGVSLVENDEVATIIVKGMSHLGRDYLLVGQYTEMIFPNYGVRFTAVNNNVDKPLWVWGQRFHPVCEPVQRFLRQRHQPENPRHCQIEGGTGRESSYKSALLPHSIPTVHKMFLWKCSYVSPLFFSVYVNPSLAKKSSRNSAVISHSSRESEYTLMISIFKGPNS
ncbi:MAG: Recombinase [Desulfotomaculum sp. 46_296]|nr:MAG: Recombinase [Desulfotomaculum sp. 46_296]